ncbi:hypothetical protein O9929_19760 [Vibrio lentus]|nr:hypothetical protein [Vibrio lentus]
MDHSLTCTWVKKQKRASDRLSLLPRLLTAYQAILAKLAKLGAEWVLNR